MAEQSNHIELEKQFYQLLQSSEEANVVLAFELIKGTPSLNSYLAGYLALYRYFFDESLSHLEYDHFVKLNQSEIKLGLPYRNLLNARSSDLLKEIGLLHNLKSLSLEYNYLTSIPPETGRLKELKELNLSYNFIQKLPSEIGQLEGLEFMSFKGNEITNIPLELLQLQNLKYIDLEDNQLTSIPSGIKEMKSLRKICLYGNPITKISRLFIKRNLPVNCEVVYNEISRGSDVEMSDYYLYNN